MVIGAKAVIRCRDPLKHFVTDVWSDGAEQDVRVLIESL